ncbi:hypothetical protein Dvina_32295 [Dactylosporangium vinaceum]|uniref:AMIN-like domain-containing protein n=1 Tax=Dactylosporangium vinaceum TaxID=53362 RepID=A0ABV5MAI5_9ACTN|nr:hypothetical protein [Dactylosporangium vinaceum]UAB92973.1 hypothetical protein Dvina_32295 [Dactylosporangium vinaceum]
MAPYSKLTVLMAAVLLATVPAGCGRPGAGGAPGPAGPAPTLSGTASASAGPSSPAPVPSSSSSPAATATASNRVVSASVAYPWHWPNDPARPGAVRHDVAVPPVPALVAIGAASHPASGSQPAFDRMSFTFTAALPGYRFAFVDQLVGDAGGRPVPIAGRGVLRVIFQPAQAHTADGTASSIGTQPRRPLHLTRMVDYAAAGDFEGVLTYGIGIDRPGQGNPQPRVRAYEVVRIGAGGRTTYTVAIDIAWR